MAVPTGNADLFLRPLLFTALSFFLLSSSFVSSLELLDIDSSDFKALQVIETELGVNGQRFTSNDVNPCGRRGVSCERRRSAATGEYVLRVTRLVYRSRSLTGAISPVIGRLSELKELTLSNNQLVNAVPVGILSCKQLEVLDLRNNRFSGQIPGNFSSLSRLRILDLSSNKFSGNLNFLKNLRNLENLSVANNLFSGKIPKPIVPFHTLRFFDFSGNRHLEGSVPVMSKIKLQTTPRHTRHILAETPSSNSTKKSNNTTTSKAPKGAPKPEEKKKKKKKSKKKKVAAWILGFVVGAIGGTISGFVFSVMFKLIVAAIKGSGKPSGPSIFSPLIKKAEDLAFLEDEEAIASLEVIGKGGCGEVFKAELPGSNGKLIAVKKVIQPSKDANELADEDSKFMNKKMRQIRSEINTVGQIRHRNLLPLLAHVSRPECHFLVYEYMKNGSLQDILTEVLAGQKELMWPARHKIALGIAAGLEYLHMDHKPRIIHRDLKPANVLLDDDMEARIADFGLAKSMPDAATHLTLSNVAGTVGYIAPEYHQTIKFTDKCDIYSFGVILGVLVIGKLPSDEFFQHTDEMSLIKWMRNIITSENPSVAIDPTLLGQGFDEQMLLVLKIACYCTLDDPKQRPNSKDVRTMLSQIKH
ncbi:PREDICTED: leucine-rich repeat receptor-like serine/threonine/tyrosine-protein kinase SOBIR1 [Camelina sativa]|uniref:Leucine-rich repeat receptor-like serine/threonine/tyrosine-protein kinase SOBIR1 n=1 Tax=Camelina sativa TaxID=90675 RepID=A0ABM0SP37_CAMSA|nr:PREDICTED: leucine-rich repeat receptor-like serine/threonine/tyrosine-protein kinase SOBIR1 [Camelina sativa]